MANDSWKGQSGDWNTGTLWSAGTMPGTADTAILATTTSYTVYIGENGTESDVVQAVSLSGTAASLDLFAAGTLSVTGLLTQTSGDIFDSGSLSLGSLAMSGGYFDVEGAAPLALHGASNLTGGELSVSAGSTLANGGSINLIGGELLDDGLIAGGTIGGNSSSDLSLNTGTLSGATINGTVNLQNGYYGTSTIVNGVHFATGAVLDLEGYGTLALTGGLGLVAGSTLVDSDIVLQINDAETVSAGLLELGAVGATIFAGTGLTIGAGATLAEASNGGVYSSAPDQIIGTFVNDGLLIVGTNDVLSLAKATVGAYGSIALAAGSTLDIGSVSIGQLGSIASSTSFGAGSKLGVVGSLYDAGGTLSFGTGALGAELYLGAADVVGGTIAAPGATVSVGLGTLTGVTVEGTLELANTTTVFGGLALEGAGGTGPGTLILDGVGLHYLDSETISNAVVIASGSEQITAPGTNAVLTIGANSTVDVTSGVLGILAAAGSVFNDGTIVVGQSASLLVEFSGANFTNNGVIQLNGGNLELDGSLTTAQLAAIVANIRGTGTIEVEGTLSGASPAVNLPLPTEIFADVIGATLVNSGSLIVEGGTLDHATVQGPLVIGGYVTVANGLTLDQLGGAAGGTVSFTAPYEELIFLDAETLSAAVLNVPASTYGDDAIASVGTLVGLAAGLTVNDAGPLAVIAQTVANAANIAVTGSGAALNFQTDTLLNSGSIFIGAGDTFALGNGSGTLDITGNNLVTLASGATLELNAVESTTQVLGLLNGAAGINLVLQGTLTGGPTLAVGGAGGPASLQLDSSVTGATIANLDGSLVVGSPYIYTTQTFAGATFDGPVTIASGVVAVTGGLTLLGTQGSGSGTLTLSTGGGYESGELEILDAETLNNAAITLQSGEIFDIGPNGSLGLGSSLVLDATGASSEVSASTLVNAGTIAVAPGAALNLYVSTIANSGKITVAAGATLDVGSYGSLAITGTPVLAPGATLNVGATASTGQIVALLNNQTGVTLGLDGIINNAGTSIVTGAGVLTAVRVEPGADIIGGTLDASSDLSLYGGTFQTLTVVGATTLEGVYADLSIDGGLTLQTAPGQTGGILTLGTDEQTLYIQDTETLDRGTIVALGIDDSIDPEFGTLITGANFALQVSGFTNITAPTVINNGVLAATGTSGILLIDATTITNNGIISAGSGDVLGLALQGSEGEVSAASGTLALAANGVVNTGNRSSPFALTLQSGAELALGGTATSGELLGLLADGATHLSVLELGTLLNTGTVISVGTSLSALTLDGDVIGGTIVNHGGSVVIGGGTLGSQGFDLGTLDNVALFGSVVLANAVDIYDGLRVNGTAGTGVGTIMATGDGVDDLNFVGSGSLNNAFIDAPDALLSISVTSTLGVGPSTLSVGGGATILAGAGLELAATSIVNAGSIIVPDGAGDLILESGTLLNSQLIQVGSGDALGIDYNGAGGLADPLDFANTGTIAIAAADTVYLGASETTFQLEQMLATLDASSIDLVILGTLNNTGTTLVMGSGLLSNVTLDADVIGGTLVNGGGIVDVVGGTFDDVAFVGPLNLVGSNVDLTLKNSFALQGASGGAGLLNDTAVSAELIVADTLTPLSGMTIDVVPTAAGGAGLEIYGVPGSLTLGAGVAIDTASAVQLVATTISSAANVTAISGAARAVLAFDGSTISTSGSLVFGVDTALEIDPGATGTLVVSGTSPVTMAPGSTLVVGGLESTPALTTLVNSAAQTGVKLVLQGSIINTGATLTLAAGPFGRVGLDATVVGGTVLDLDRAVTYQNVVFQGVTFDGSLDVTNNNADITLRNGFTLLNTSGIGPGTVTLAGSGDVIDVVGSATLDDVNALITGSSAILEHGTLTLGPQYDATVTGHLTDYGSTLTNDGTIIVAGSGASLLFEDQSVFNAGLISVGSGDVLAIDVAASTGATLPFLDTGTGTVSLAAGATLALYGTETDTQLGNLLAAYSNPAVVLDLEGTLLNQGSLLATATGTTLNDVVLAGADIIGGTISNASGTLTVKSATFNGVTFEGPLTVGSASALTVVNGLTLEGPGGAGSASLSMGSGADLAFQTAQTLSNLAFSIAGANDLVSFSTLTLASSVALTVSGNASFTGATLVLDTPLSLAAGAGEVALDDGTLINNGGISIGAGDTLSLQAYYGGTLAIGGTGGFAFAPGSELILGGAETTAQLQALVGSLIGAQTGVTIELQSEIANSGTSLVFPAEGSLSDVILDATVVGGTIVAEPGASVSVIGGEFESVAFDGLLNLTGPNAFLSVYGSLEVANADGSLPGTLAVSGANDQIAISEANGATTLSNLVIEGAGSNFTLNAAELYYADAPATEGIAEVGVEQSTLTIAASVLSEETGQVTYESGLIATAGTLVAGAAGSALYLDAGTVANTGTISVAAGALLGIGNAQYTLSNGGSIFIASGSTLVLGGSVTTSQFLANAAALENDPSVTLGFGLGGTLTNSGTTLVVGTGGASSNFLFDQATVLGGTILATGSVGFAGIDTFQNVTFLGPLTMSTPNATALFTGTSSVTNPGGTEAISVLGSSDTIIFDPVGSVPSLTPNTILTLANTQIVLGSTANTFGNSGSLSGSSAGSRQTLEVEGGGTIFLAATTPVQMYAGTELEVYAATSVLDTTLANLGTITASGGGVSIVGVDDLSTYNTPITSAVFVNAGTIAAGAGASSVAAGTSVLSLSGGTFFNTGSILVSGAVSANVGAAHFSNTGLVDLSNGATLDFTAAPSAVGDVYMADGAETLRWDNGAELDATVTDFTDGDTIDLSRVAFAGASGTLVNGVYDVFSGTTLVADVTLPSFAYAPTDLTLTSDGSLGTAITTDITTTVPPPPPCFLAGTRIRTRDGEVAVEDLAAGMEVMTRDGSRPIMWIGQRRVDCHRHPHPERVQPVRVCKGAFGPGLPVRDLLLSPDHSLFVDGVLIPVQHLVNGATIRREHVDAAHYFHVELTAHDVLFAEGLAAESYLDTGNRAAFANGADYVMLHPDFFPRSWTNACAPLCESGAVLERVRARLQTRLRRLGYRAAAATAPVLQVGDRIVVGSVVKGELYRYLLPAGATSVQILSDAGIPASLPRGTGDDRRQLGAAIAGILLDGRPIPLDSPLLVSGFWEQERHRNVSRRWTDGCAVLDLPPARTPRVLELRVLETMPAFRKAARTAKG